MTDTKIATFQSMRDNNETRVVSEPAESAIASGTIASNLYVIDLALWGIYNDGTHPLETEKGINDAIVWAKTSGYDGVYLRSGTYLIEPTYYGKSGGASPGVDKYVQRGIRPVSNSIFQMSPDTIIQVASNTAHMHTAILIYKVENVTISGGQVLGDKDTHIWTYYQGYGMGGHGYGLYISQSRNIKVYDTLFAKHHGDGVVVYDGMANPYMSKHIYMKGVVCHDNCRQGMSIVAGDDMLFEDCTFSGSNGQAPECGVDIESGQYASQNITFRRCKFTKNNRDGLLNYSGNVRLENCVFTQGFGINPGASDVEVYDSTFGIQDYEQFFNKYPYLLTAETAYKLGDRARIDLKHTSEGYTCTKAGTTSGTMARKNNWPPAQIQSSMLGIVLTYGDTEWIHTDNVYTYSSGGISGITSNRDMPATLRANSTAYLVGDLVRLKSGTPLICIAEGTTDIAEPNITGKYVGDTLPDGEVKWNITDKCYPNGYRQNSTVYTKGDIVWWDNGKSVWECVTSGTTATVPPTLKDLPNGTILIAHAATSRIKKVDYNPTAPDWQPNINKNHLDVVNIAGTSWQFWEKRNYNLTFSAYSTGDTEPDITCIPRGDTITDGSVIWKKVTDYITQLTVEGSTFTNTGINAGAGAVVLRNNKITNGFFKATGFDVISNGNIIQNTNPDNTGKAVEYNLNTGRISDEVIKGSKVTTNIKYDRKIPEKRNVENLLLEDCIYSSKAPLLNSSIVFTDKLKLVPRSGFNSILPVSSLYMIGGNFSATLSSPNYQFFDCYKNYFHLDNVVLDLTLVTGARFLTIHSRSTDGWYPKIENCIFRVLPLDHVSLITVGYSDANIQLINNKFFNSDPSKSINLDIPPGDKVNTWIRNNYFDMNYYVTDINSVNNIGGYGIRTTLESIGAPISGKYAIGTRVMNISPSIGSPKSWLVTTAGLAYSPIRANSTVYTVGTFVKWPSGNNIYECVVAGTTAASTPAAGMGNVMDGTVVWLYRGNNTAVFTTEGNL